MSRCLSFFYSISFFFNIEPLPHFYNTISSSSLLYFFRQFFNFILYYFCFILFFHLYFFTYFIHNSFFNFSLLVHPLPSFSIFFHRRGFVKYKRAKNQYRRPEARMEDWDEIYNHTGIQKYIQVQAARCVSLSCYVSFTFFILFFRLICY